MPYKAFLHSEVLYGIALKERIVNMESYKGKKCFSCGEIFKENDDIVVCPDCGTPYHRECYAKEGKCINEELHKNGGSWRDEAAAENAAEGENLRCPRCGAENAPDKLFCEKCGTPLISGSEQSVPFNDAVNGNKNPNMGQNPNGTNRYGPNQQYGQNPYGQNDPNGQQMPPFGQQMVFDKDSVIDGIKLDDYAKYVGGNPLGFLSNFIKFGKFGGKTSMNFFAFLFPEVYLLYRKIRPWGIIAMILTSVLSVPNVIEVFGTVGYANIKIGFGFDVTSPAFTLISYVCWYLMLALRILFGLFANYLYYKQAKKDINAIRSEEAADEQTIKEKIIEKGGTSWLNVIVGFTVSFVITVGSVILLSKLK